MDPSPTAIESRLLALAARLDIQELLARYSMARDDGDLDTLVDFFTIDGEFIRHGEVVRGREQLRKFFAANMVRYALSLHTVHVPAIELRGADAAGGLVNGHAELIIDQVPYWAAYRYTDDYQRVDGRWQFARRQLRFMYAVPAADYVTSFADVRRVRWPGQEPAAADYPESQDLWWTTHDRAEPPA
jgi:hypothetical protein